MSENKKQWAIRPGKPEDLPDIVTFQLLMARETENIMLDRPTVEKGVQRIFDEPARGQYWVAEASSGDVIGSLLTLYEWSDWRNGDVVWIHSVFVREDFRRFGVFSDMYQHLKALVMHNEQLRGLRLYVDTTNLRACQVYQSLGMNGDHYKVYEWMKTY
jgi:GNAT superfamily N-acetyltransferase